MTNITRKQPFDAVSIPRRWHPPRDIEDSAAFNYWVEKKIESAKNPQRWIVGLLVTLNELQIKRCIQRGDRLITMDSPFGMNWTSIVLNGAIERLEAQGYEIPSLAVECQEVA